MNPESTPKYFDIHAHTNFAAFDYDRDEAVKRALDAGVWFANVGTQVDTSKKAIELAEKYEEGVYAIVGLHPIHTAKSFHDEKELGPSFTEASAGKEEGFISRGEIFDSKVYLEMAKHPKVVAIGECGLDYYSRITNQDTRFKNGEDTNKIQEEAFRKQIELAIEVGKPLMLHLRNGSDQSAYNDAFSILESCILNRESTPRGNLHFFAGTIEEAKPFLDLGFSFSFTGVVTFAKDYEEIVRYLPLERIMSETDSPYVSPVPYRGKRNEPLYVQEVVKAIAGIKKMDLEEVERVLASNARTFFGV